ncbi:MULTISPECIES: tRNA (adenosine(37)-N6)-threonylcarbamoyltransferase complex ATPase subunit type 1 TsaE [Prochlorococcus]|uniref:tRNA (adenosine(37)-N6)-threonylcarbamoyltransferase complex ATPase subunit type 1 TsaE n=1 Tax=Prochlorococcus TaxID=1218 RepID=UPI0005339E46|nr:MULTISPECIES: tRNA (adenosine(37)-N6)-threonylcarbamoyltransferase complex ATPase subunit type 1 TsaE [Prochlorococcus]KGG13656.1 ATPase YjeE [Prochlorococcus sp. MIT 0601]
MQRNIFKNIKVPESIVWQSNQSGWLLNNLEATIAFGEILSQKIQSSKILLLEGPLGSGKTSLVKGIAKGLQILEPITSPTFPLSQHYLKGKRALIHLDLYRLDSADSANELFIQEEEEAKDLKALMVIEWPSRLKIDLEDAWHVNLTYTQDNKRLIKLFSPY